MREEQYLLQQHLVSTLEIVTLIYSKIEQNDRQAKKETNIISFIVEILQADSEEILTL
jgi:hypothetical protein